MATEVCPVCGLPKDLCVCVEISKEQQRITVRLKPTKFRRVATLIEGLDPKAIDLKRLASKLKAKCACGGSVKNDVIILQGDHRREVVEILVEEGFPRENIEVL